jgi:hypothetical protein
MSFDDRFRRRVPRGLTRASHGRFGNPSLEVEELARETQSRAQGSRFRLRKILESMDARVSEKLDKTGPDPGQ